MTLDVTVVVVAGEFTTWFTALDVLVWKLPSPPYTAVMEWLPTLSVVVLNVAVPPLSVPVTIVVTPSLNVTLPVGVPAPGATDATVAVNVTDCPKLDGFRLDVSVVAVFALFTNWISAGLVLVVCVASPPYTAVIECVPTASADVANVAVAEVPLAAVNVPVPRVVAPSLNVTVPVGVVEPPVVSVTVAVKVTDCPKTDGLTLDVTVVVVAHASAFVPVKFAVCVLLPLLPVIVWVMSTD